MDIPSIEQAFLLAACGQTSWSAALEVVSELSDACGALMFAHDGGPPITAVTDSMQRITEYYYKESWHTRDERNKALGIVRRRGVTCEFDYTSADSHRSSSYYHELLRPHGLAWFAGVALQTPEEKWVLSLQRSEQQGPYTPEQLSELKGLSQRLGSVAALARSLGFARLEGALSAFDLSETPVALLDRRGQVLQLNTAAEGLLGEDLYIVDSRLVARLPTVTAQLESALREILWSQEKHVLGPAISIPRALKRPLVAYPARLRGITIDGLSPCQVLITFVDLDRCDAPSDVALRTVYGLTPSEAALARALASNLSVEQAADALAITKETARSRLKDIFAKTDVQRQSQLVALLSRLK